MSVNGETTPLLQEKFSGSNEESGRSSESKHSREIASGRWEKYKLLWISCFVLILVLCRFVALGVVVSVRRVGSNGPPGPLRFRGDGTFRISVFEDLHFGENAWEQWGPEQDKWTLNVMNTVLDAESPQLVVFNGDLITGENTFLENSTDYIDMIMAPLVQRGLPWASAYGNHDSAFNLSRDDMLSQEQLYSNALTTRMVDNINAGLTNYYVPIHSSGVSNAPCLILWFFDSRGGHHFQQLDDSDHLIEQPNWVDESVVEWFKKTRGDLAQIYGRTIPSLAFVHIPTNASRALQTEVSVEPHHQPGINDDYPLAQQSQGWCEDNFQKATCDYGGQDVPFMAAITSTPGLIALFSGHDHGDTWCYRWEDVAVGRISKGNGVNLCFGQHTGYGGYGSWTRGSRQILITETMLDNLEIETWIRLETGEVVGSVTLNSTYNQDYYVATKNSHSRCPSCE